MESRKSSEKSNIYSSLLFYSDNNSYKKPISITIDQNLLTKETYIKSCQIQSFPGKNQEGQTKINQDSFITIFSLNNIKDLNIFSVLDGHGPEGHLISNFFTHYIQQNFPSIPQLKNYKSLEEIYHSLKKLSFKPIVDFFLEADKYLFNQKKNFDPNFSGTTCNLVLQIGYHLICFNIGDSRTILIKKEMIDSFGYDYEIKTEELSQDHKPDDENEAKRIKKMGGYVDRYLDSGGVAIGRKRVYRKNGNFPALAMTRSLGDGFAKVIGVIAQADFLEYNLKDKESEALWMVVASDGIWEMLTNYGVMNIGKEYLKSKDSCQLCKELVSSARKKWKMEPVIDDITAIVIMF